MLMTMRDQPHGLFMPILAPLLRYGFVNYLEGGISFAGHHPDLATLIITVPPIFPSMTTLHRPRLRSQKD